MFKTLHFKSLMDSLCTCVEFVTLLSKGENMYCFSITNEYNK